MAIDLSVLDIDLSAPDVAPPDGKAFRIPLSDVEPDPNQPRIEKPEEEIAELGAAVRERGVKQPISVRPHPTLPGKYIINDGEMRYRASLWAQLPDIPAVVDEDFDDFDQVNANEKRFNLRPLELAVFVDRKVGEGMKKGEIAKRLGKSSTVISELLAFIDCPAPILDAYSQGRISSPRTVYDLRGLHEKFPAQVEQFLSENAGDIERRMVSTLSEALKGGGKSKGAAAAPPTLAPAPADAPVVAQDGGGNDAQDSSAGGSDGKADAPISDAVVNAGSVAAAASSPAADTPQVDGGEGDKAHDAIKGQGAGSPEVTQLLAHNPANNKALDKAPAAADPSRLKKPLLLVEHDGRAAMVLIFSRPSTPGLLKIKYEDTAEEVEVDAGACKINSLADAG